MVIFAKMKDSTDHNVNPQDLVQDAMGIMGKWQIIITVAMSLVNLPAAWNQLAIVVIAPSQDFKCLTPSSFSSNYSMHRACMVKINESLPEVRCDKFSYDDSIFKSTIMSEWDLVCDRKHLLSLVQPLTEVSIILGNFGFRILADKIGRKTPFMIAVVLQAIFLIITSFITFPQFFPVYPCRINRNLQTCNP